VVVLRLFVVPRGRAIKLLATKGTPPPDCSGQGEGRSFLASSRASCAVAAAPSFERCLRACIYTFCMCVYICVFVYVCGHVYIYVCACVYVYVYVCVYTHVYVYVYTYLCIDFGSQYQYFNVWTVSCKHMCVRVHMYAYAYVCRYMNMCIFLQ